MKHARPDYNRIQDPAGLIPEDEPVFLLRAQDEFAPECVARWVNLARASGGVSQQMVAAAMDQIQKMNAWQLVHGRKKPDMENDAAPPVVAEELEPTAHIRWQFRWHGPEELYQLWEKGEPDTDSYQCEWRKVPTDG